MSSPAGLFIYRASGHHTAMRLAILALPCLVIASCAPRSADEPATTATTTAAADVDVATTTVAAARPTPAATLAPVDTLAGEWRVAGIDGEDFNEPYGLALSGSGDELWWEPRCAGVARTYRIDGFGIRFAAPADTRSASSGAPLPPPCVPGQPARLVDVMRALDAAATVGRTPSNGVEISGGGHSVLLFSQ